VLRAVFAETSLVAIEPGRVVLSCTSARFAASARARERQIAEIFERELGRRVDVVIEAGPAPAESPDAAPIAGPAPDLSRAEPAADHASATASAPAQTPAPPGADPGEHPLVKTAIELLGARIVSVQPRHHQ
jgi:hypothetical protein